MSRLTQQIHFFCLSALAIVLVASCKKSVEQPVPKMLPLETFTYQLYDSVEGKSGVKHFELNRILEFQYDPNVDKCYLPKENVPEPKIDTFDRSAHWKRGYVNRNDFFHRIIFNGDTITIHHNTNNTVGTSNFRFTQGVRL
jgi:hypothetical protein